MSNHSTTYTLLVTVSHEGGAAISTDLLEVMVQRGLEEGVREMAGIDAATVSALVGDHLPPEFGVSSVKRLHRELRA